MRAPGDWETWLEFFLKGVKETSEQAAQSAHEILSLFEEDRRRIEGLGLSAASVLRIHQHMQLKPILSIPIPAEQLSISAPTAAKAFQAMLKLGIVREANGKKRRRQFAYQRYIAILNKDTEPIDQG